MQFQQAIKQQTEDLREELNDLAKWEAEVAAKEQERKKRAASSLVTETPTVPPIRGTVPSLKAAVQAASSTTKSSAPKADPIQEAKDNGNEYFRRGEIDDAIRMYTRGIDVDPDSATTHVLYANRAMCYLKQQKWELAEKDATICIQMNRGFTKAFYRRALARKNLKKYRDARSDLETVLAFNPTGDAETEAELKVVTQLMHQQDAEKQLGAPKRKKLVIAEVENEDEDEPENSAPKVSAEEEAQRKERIDRDMAQLQAKRDAEEAEQRRKVAQEELLRQKKRQASSKVEVVEEEDEEPAPAPPPAAAPRKTAAAAASGSRDRQSQPQPRVIQQEWTVDNLKVPKNFVEFERVYKDLANKPELLDHFLSIIPAASFKPVLGVNLYPELLADLLKSAARGGGARARELLLAIATVPRVEELAMFFDDAENQSLQSAIQLAQSAGATAQEIAKIKKAFA